RSCTAGRQGTVRPPPRRTGTWSRSIGLPGKESRGPLQDLPLLAQHLVFALELAQALPLVRAEHVISLATVGLVLPQPVAQRLLRAAKLGRQGGQASDQASKRAQAGTGLFARTNLRPDKAHD